VIQFGDPSSAIPIQGRYMKKLAILIVLALPLAISGCGSTTLANTPVDTTTTGNWEAELTGGTGAASQLNFVTSFTVTDNGSGTNLALDITGFNFFNAGACFINGIDASTEAGTATFSAATGTDQVTGQLSYTITSHAPAGNVLTLNSYQDGLTGTSTNGTSSVIGTLSNGVVVGTWTLKNSSNDASCQGSGTFLMCEGTNTCTAPAP
jgi:hypothetical protein